MRENLIKWLLKCEREEAEEEEEEREVFVCINNIWPFVVVYLYVLWSKNVKCSALTLCFTFIIIIIIFMLPKEKKNLERLKDFNSIFIYFFLFKKSVIIFFLNPFRSEALQRI